MWRRASVRKKAAQEATSGEALAQRGYEVLQQYAGNGDPQALDDAITLLEDALTATRSSVGDVRSSCLSNLCTALQARYGRSRQPDDLDRAIRRGEEAAAMMTPEDSGRSVAQASLGSALAQRGLERLQYAVVHNDASALEASIEASERAVTALPVGHSARMGSRCNLASALYTRFEWASEASDLDRAIGTVEDALAEGPPDHPARAESLTFLSNALADRYERDGRGADVEGAVAAAERATTLVAPDRPDRYMCIANLSRALRLRYGRTGQKTDLERAVELGEEAVADVPTDEAARGACLMNLCVAVYARYSRDGRAADLERVIDLCEEALETIGQDDRLRGTLELDLSQALATRYDRTNRREDLERALDLSRRALAGTNPGRSDRFRYLGNAADVLWRSYESSGRLVDLERSIELGQQAVEATPPGQPDLAHYLANLAAMLRLRHKRTGADADLDRATRLSERALSVTSHDGPDRPALLSNLGNSMKDVFARSGDPSDLERAILLGEEAVATAPPDDPGRAQFMANLGVSLRARHARTGNEADLDRAIDLIERALAACPAGRVERSKYLSNLQNALVNRYTCAGRLADLDRAVEIGEHAVETSPVEDPDRAALLVDLGIALQTRYQRTGDEHDLDRALEHCEMAVAATMPGDTARPSMMVTLENTLRIRYESGGRREDLDRAIALATRSAADAGHDDRAKVGHLVNAAVALLRRGVDFGESTDLDRAVVRAAEAVSVMPDDEPARAEGLRALGDSLWARNELRHDPADLQQAVAAFRDAAGTASAGADVRALAARSWGATALKAGLEEQALEGYTLAVTSLGEIAPLWLGRADQVHRLAELGGIGQEAAAACLHAGHPERAVELFEQGRGVLFAQMLDTRTDLTDLTRAHPTLAGEFKRLATALADPDPGGARQQPPLGKDVDGPAGRRAAADLRRQDAGDLRRVLRDIRRTPGFETFLLPRPVDQLMAASRAGPVVMVNVSDVRSDALVLGPGSVDVVALPRLRPVEAVDHADALLALYDQRHRTDPSWRRALDARLSDTLEWLWDTVSAPVLAHLGFTAAPTGDGWPHVHWCASGALAVLPLHAAGYHETRFSADPATVIDRVISSFTPTVRALLHAGRPRRSTRTGPRDARHRVLVVAMPDTPGSPPLPGAAAEAAHIAGLLPGQVDVLGGPGAPLATYDTVSAALPAHPWAHFACHGASDLRNPSASRLLLNDHQSHPFTVLDLSHAALDDAELAFLSACTTAHPGIVLPDEPVHLAAACQLAGYRHVIATLWPVRDVDALHMTRAVYSSLVEAEGAATAGADGASLALHRATRRLRSLTVHEPSRWASHVHLGP
jgi:tetratricopeptide (TPR) repeat protein